MPRCPDAFGNVHNRVDDRGLVVFRDPGRYVGRHRRPYAPWWLRQLYGLPPGRPW